MHFTLNDILANFDGATFSRGKDYAQRGKVNLALQMDDFIEGDVDGSGGATYEQQISVVDGRRGIAFEGDCSCPMQYNCKHVVAVLLSCLTQQASTSAPAPSAARPANAALPYPMQAWMRRVGEAAAAAAPVAALALAAPPAKASKKIAYRLIYVLCAEASRGRLQLMLCKGRLRADGTLASATLASETYSLSSYPPDYVQHADQYPVRLFMAMQSGSGSFGALAEPKEQIGAQLLRTLLEQGRLLAVNSRAELKAGPFVTLRSGPSRIGHLNWRVEDEVTRLSRLAWHFDDGTPAQHVLSTEPAMYLHGDTLGELEPAAGAQAIPMRQLQELVAQAPLLNGGDQLALAHQLIAHGLETIVPAPLALQEVVRSDIAPRPYLMLGSVPDTDRHTDLTTWHDFALLAFDYDGKRVAQDPDIELIRSTRLGTERIVRDARAEQAARARLVALGLDAAPTAHPALRQIAGLMGMPSPAAWIAFTRDELPGLRADGWIVEIGPDFRFDLSAVDDWYADVTDGAESGNAWFDLELGIVVNGARVALLPVLVQLIREAPLDFNPAALAAHADTDHLLASLPGGLRVALPWGRIKPILATLGELYFNDKIGAALRLPALDAARLAELEAQAQLNWLGGQRLRAIGQKLSSFGGVQSVAAPAGLRADLRHYQSEGLAWMQFLREYGLAGILADDMGLGKTIQTLAHILLEKEAGRLCTPALVVAPTSLMGNWQAEAARFAPDLRVLLLQGPDRSRHFDQMGQFDLILTSYALLPRDEERLREQRFHLLILDESQYIKNSRSKAAQTAAMLQATHRLCLTGTPLQNHLGELWSQFHFLLPGLLGDEKRFNEDFRKPIEKLGDGARKALLIQRIKPFLLRRTKDKVATELPAKTEMVRQIELAGAQRDLYETVRLAMDKKVRAEIAKKGVARSQIVILEALLKLRQVCCDPRLVKGAAGARGVAPSAKLVALMEMIEELLDEGRKILVFSQFTSMLALIEDELKARAIAYALLTGSTLDRGAQVAAFQDGAVPIFLISLKAGGVGLNLTAADTVIHYDPWWNPAAENQATDRAWRIGQDKPVFVYKLIAKGTLEEKIQELQRQKGDLADAILAGGQNDGRAMTQDDLQAIFAPL
jgi:hypothetical protein